MSITLTKENFIQQIPLLYDMLWDDGITISKKPNTHKASHHEKAMEDLKNNVDISSHADFTDLMKKRWVTI